MMTRRSVALSAAAVALSLPGMLVSPLSADAAGSATPRGNAYYDDNAGLPGGGGMQAKTSAKGDALVSLLVFVDACTTDAPMLNSTKKVVIGQNGFFSSTQKGDIGNITVEGAFVSKNEAVGTVKVDPTELGGSTPTCSYRGAFKLLYDAG